MSWEFEVGILLITILILFVLNKSNKKIIRRFWLAFIGVLIFEYITHPLWTNANLENWAYLYLDISWIVSLCWVDIILISMFIGEYFLKKYKEIYVFLSIVLLSTVFGLCLEWLFLKLGIRIYSSTIKKYLESTYRIFGVVPAIEILYVLVFLSLIIGFIRYWEIVFDHRKDNKKIIKKRGKK